MNQQRHNCILEAIRQADQQGFTPSIRELQTHCRVSSTSVVKAHLIRMEQDGLITFGQRGHSRSYRLTDKGRGYPSDQELLTRCLEVLQDRCGVVGGALIEDLHARLA